MRTGKLFFYKKSTGQKSLFNIVRFLIDILCVELASCLIYARAYVIFILWVRSFSKILTSMKFAEDKVLI